MAKKSNEKYPGLSKKGDPKIRHDLYDFDYIDKLNDKEKKFLSDFNLEYISGDLNHPGKRLHKKKIKTRKVASTGKLRKFDVGAKSINDMNNARNRDAYSICKSNGILKGEKDALSGIERKESSINDMENAIVELIDLKSDPEALALLEQSLLEEK